VTVSAGSGQSAVPSDFAAQVIAATKLWLERAVIGLRLCPFAAPVHLSNRVRYFVSEQHSSAGLAEDLARELQALQDVDPAVCETTLLIHPYVLTDFLTYNDFLDEGDHVLTALDLDGELQIASFHPAYRFAGTAEGDIENYTNRSPYPMLHLLREDSITRAIETHDDIDDIGEKNIETLRRLGHEGWQRLWINAA
jgi:hypothetical protein